MILRLMLALAFMLAAHAAGLPRADVEGALLRAGQFFREKVAVEGTYLWQYSPDLSLREGEGKASPSQGWVQPPGTPSVGMAFLEAWAATTNRYFLDAARETAHGLIRGQLRSGGWQHSIELDPELRKKFGYRDGGGKNGRNVTTFDDDSTQSAIRFLLRADAALGSADANIHEALHLALTSVLKAQYPNGSWPQGFEKFPEPEKFPVQKATFPETWSKTYPGTQEYWFRYTLNDNNHATLVETLYEAAEVCADSADPRFTALASECRKAAESAGDFLILAQMPDPQPAWAQQYDFQTQPAWARKFEPPAISGGESQGALRTLLKIYSETGDAKYLEPIPKALAYLKNSRLPDGRLARFYELRSNRPLYFTKDYQLTYDDSDVPTHYSFKVGDQMDRIEREYNSLRQLPKAQLKARTSGSRPPSEAEARDIIRGLDSRGAWVEAGRLKSHSGSDAPNAIIRSATFNRNMEGLARYLRQSEGK